MNVVVKISRIPGKVHDIQLGSCNDNLKNIKPHGLTGHSD